MPEGSTWSEADEAVRRELTGAVRDLMPSVTLTLAGDAEMREALDLLRAAKAKLDGSVRSSRYEDRDGLIAGAGRGNDPLWETHATYGHSQPLAPPVVVTEEEGRVHGTVTFGTQYEGGPGLVYGGFMAAEFDGLCGRSILSAGHTAVTRQLTVRYRRPTPLRTELRVEASVDEVDGRDVKATARMFNGEELTADAEAIFRIVGDDQYVIPKP